MNICHIVQSRKSPQFRLDNKIFNVLNKNIENLKLDNVKPINIGVGEKLKYVKTSDIDKTNVGMTKIISDDGNVLINTLDEILFDVKNISLIKIDVEGYEKNVLLGAKNIILKHSPVIIAELRDGEEFNEFEKIANELGYFTDKINYASTPTYFWYNRNKLYEYVYIIPTYERFDKAFSLIKNILGINRNSLVIVLNDGSKDERYKEFINFDHRIIYLENKTNNGKDGYWITINKLLDELSKYNFKYGIMLGDDFELINGFIEKLENVINKNDIIRLFTQTSVGETNWGFKNWIDGAFCAPYSFFEKINFELFPIKKRNTNSSSGVGLQMTERLNKLKYNVKNYGSFINHIGNDDSKMHPELRKKQPLLTKFESYKNDLSIIIPTFNTVEYLYECLESIIKCIKNLNCEILVGIDGCKKTLDSINGKFFDKRIRFFFFEKNVGPYVVKNSLTLKSNSNYILFFDSDDIIKEDLIQDVMSYKSNYDLIKPMYLDFQKSSNNINYNITLTKTYGEGVFAIKKDVFLTLNGFEGWRCAADSELMKRLYKNNVKLFYTKNIGFYRRVHTESLTKKSDTGFGSELRHNYITLTSKKNNFKPLPTLITEPFTEIGINYTDISNTEEFLLRKNILDLVSKFYSKQKNDTITKEIDYNQINSINIQNNVYQPKNHIQPIRQNIPDDRNKIIEIKKGSLAEQALKMSSNKVNRRNNIPNIFSNKKR